MKEQLISFETAKLAKQKGFDEETHWRYDLDIGSECHCEIDYWNDKAFEGKHISAPTQSLLQKWLREKYGIFIGIDQQRTQGYSYYVEEAHHKDWATGTPSQFIDIMVPIEDEILEDSYEEALEQGLVEALKLIEN